MGNYPIASAPADWHDTTMIKMTKLPISVDIAVPLGMAFCLFLAQFISLPEFHIISWKYRTSAFTDEYWTYARAEDATYLAGMTPQEYMDEHPKFSVYDDKAHIPYGALCTATDPDAIAIIAKRKEWMPFEVQQELLGSALHCLDYYGNTASDNDRIIKALDAFLAAVDGPKLVNTPMRHFGMPIKSAIRDDLGDVVDVLLRHGADPNAIIDYNKTPLLYSLRYSKGNQIIRSLLEHGASPNIKGNLNSPLHDFMHYAPYDGDNRTADANDYTKTKAIERLRMLINAGADVEARNSINETPLMKFLQYAERWQTDQPIDILIEAGADPRTEDDYGNSLWTKGRSEITLELVPKLLSYGVDPNISGSSALTRAVGDFSKYKQTALPAVKALLDAGANAFIPSQNGRSPAQVMHASKDAELTEIYQKYVLPKLSQYYSSQLATEDEALAAATRWNEIAYLLLDGRTHLHVETAGERTDGYSLATPATPDDIRFLIKQAATPYYLLGEQYRKVDPSLKTIADKIKLSPDAEADAIYNQLVLPLKPHGAYVNKPPLYQKLNPVTAGFWNYAIDQDVADLLGADPYHISRFWCAECTNRTYPAKSIVTLGSMACFASDAYFSTITKAHWDTPTLSWKSTLLLGLVECLNKGTTPTEAEEMLSRAKVLLEHGADPNTFFGHGTLLYNAAKQSAKSPPALARLLIKHGADPNINGGEGSILKQAINVHQRHSYPATRNAEIADMLIKAGAKIDGNESYLVERMKDHPHSQFRKVYQETVRPILYEQERE